jgi:hypothetical protein
MPGDRRLERLKVAQEQAFTKKQEAYQRQQDSWKHFSDKKREMNQAFKAKQDAYDSQERAWQDYQSISGRNGPRIEYLKSAIKIANQNTKNAFDQASFARDCNDKASAKSYVMQGRCYRAGYTSYVEERRQLIEECRSAAVQYEPYKQAFESAKIAFDQAKDEHNQAKATYERADNELKHAKADFDEAAKAFQAKLAKIEAGHVKAKEDKQAIAIKAGVPYQYWNDVYISKGRRGKVNIYFGGTDKPTGLGHGHYVINSSGSIVYKRDPWDPHGLENFIDNKAVEYLIYDHPARSDKLPILSGKASGTTYVHGKEAGESVHITQVYDDGYHVSWDVKSDGTIGRIHWTNDKISLGDISRFLPPTDARNF